MDSVLNRIGRFWIKLEGGALATLLLASIVLVVTEVVLRFVFSRGLLWGHEAVLTAIAWFVLIGASYGIRTGSHIGIDGFVDRLTPRWKRTASILAVGMGIAYSGLLVAGAWTYLSKMKTIGVHMEDLPIPVWVAHSPLILGFLLLALTLFRLLLQLLLGHASGFSFADEARDTLEQFQPDPPEVDRT